MNQRLCLASASPRRRELLWQLGVPHDVAAADIDERRLRAETALQCVRRLALAKAQAVWNRAGGRPEAVLGADTEVVLAGELLGKPRDAAHGLLLLQRLSGRSHVVLSAVALITTRGSELLVSRSRVEMRTLAESECRAYWASGEPQGKAGGYAIQGLGAAFIKRLEGSYSGVMGLPLFETASLLKHAGIPIWQSG